MSERSESNAPKAVEKGKADPRRINKACEIPPFCEEGCGDFLPEKKDANVKCSSSLGKETMIPAEK